MTMTDKQEREERRRVQREGVEALEASGAQRPLEAFYPVIYPDALFVKVRDGAHVRSKAAHIAVGVEMDGIKHVLGIWARATEGRSSGPESAPSWPTAASRTSSSSAATG